MRPNITSFVVTASAVAGALWLTWFVTANRVPDEPTVVSAEPVSDQLGVSDKVGQVTRDAAAGEDLVFGSAEYRELQRRRALAALPGSISVIDPLAQYQANLDNALAGDREAQYKVAQALQQCVGVPRSEEIGEYRNRNGLDPVVAGAIELRYENCEPLQNHVLREELDDARRSWLALAAAQGQPLAVLALHAGSEFGDQFDERKIFAEALQSGEPEVYSLMVLHYSSELTYDETELSAWNFYRCNEDPICSPEDFIDVLLDGGYEYQIGPVIDRIVEIRAALDDKKWDALLPSD